MVSNEQLMNTLTFLPTLPPFTSALNNPSELSRLAKAAAEKIGFDLVGISEPASSPHADYVRQWLASGRHGQMDYLANNIEDRLDIKHRYPWVRSIICVALSYYCEPQNDPAEVPPAAEPKNAEPKNVDQGRIARYAWGRDYHRVLTAKLKLLERSLRRLLDAPFESRIFVDTGPIMERELAARAGLGWIGKNTLLINPRHGSWFVLGELITSLQIEPDSPMPDRCGTCTRCIDHCPTVALSAYQLDATRCISYHTLEYRGEIPGEFHQPMRDAGYLVGCDICQTVCPFNSRPLPTAEPDFSPNPLSGAIAPQEVGCWTDETWDQHTRGRAFRRAKLFMWKRNAAILLGAPIINYE
jgi:epoxyqueuosine reductase